MQREAGKDPGELRRQVTSPNGMTRESLVHRKEMHETVIRFAPLLIIDQETLEWAIAGKHSCNRVPARSEASLSLT